MFQLSSIGRVQGFNRPHSKIAQVQTLVRRDVRALVHIAALDVMPQLLAFAASHTAYPFNLNDLAGPFSISLPRVRDYLNLLERVFLIDLLPARHLFSWRKPSFLIVQTSHERHSRRS
jgi:predicted AAA+ superfamily ATPase